MTPELVPILTVLVLGVIVFQQSLRRYSRADRTLLSVSFMGHMASAVGQVWITRYFYGTGDMVGYERRGLVLAALMRDDFFFWFPEVAKLLLLQQPDLPVDIFGAGASTGAMAGATGLLFFVLNDSLYASCMVVGVLAYLGKLALFKAVRGQLPEHLRRRVLIAIMMVPSVVFWTSGLTKEGFAILGLGLLVEGAWLSSKSSHRRGVPRAMVGAVLVAIAKPYILFAAIISIAAWFYWNRATARTGGRAVPIRPLYLLGAGAFSLVGLVVLGRIFPEYAVENFAEEAARYQAVGRHVAGGSNFDLGDPGTDRGIMWQLAYSPVALASALFRPLIVEARNPLMVVNGLETTVVLALVVRALFTNSPVTLWRRLRSSSMLIFCLVFTVSMGIAIGLATTNLGTLSRYRAPMFPFFATLILVWTARTRRVPSGTSAPPQAARRTIGVTPALARHRSNEVPE